MLLEDTLVQYIGHDENVKNIMKKIVIPQIVLTCFESCIRPKSS